MIGLAVKMTVQTLSLIHILQNLAEYMQEKYKGLKDPGDRPVTVSGLASEGKILFPLQKDKEAVKMCIRDS